MSRAYNFCAGPAALPQAVLEQAQQEMLDYRGLGLSIMEMSHRDNVFVEIAEQAEKDLRDLMGISDDYAVLFLQGGASSQFAMVPMNLLGEGQTADYINTGQWSKKAIKEAGRYGKINVAASSEDTNFSTVPPQDSWNLSDNPAYVHYCPNETIGGLEYSFVPAVGEFVIPELVGGPENLMIGKVLWQAFFDQNNWPLASAVAVIMVALLVIPIALFHRYENREITEGSR